MARLAFPIMAKKNEFIRIRADNDLKKALAEAAERHDRQEADQARYILRVALGLVVAEDSAAYKIRDSTRHKKQGSS